MRYTLCLLGEYSSDITMHTCERQTAERPAGIIARSNMTSSRLLRLLLTAYLPREQGWMHWFLPQRVHDRGGHVVSHRFIYTYWAFKI